jgi:hypothetical protein
MKINVTRLIKDKELQPLDQYAMQSFPGAGSNKAMTMPWV